jgi:hypothetical protein
VKSEFAAGPWLEYNYPMTRGAVLGLFDRLNVWGRGGRRAPHKPLLVLYALGRWSSGAPADIPFKRPASLCGGEARRAGQAPVAAPLACPLAPDILTS